MRIGAKHLSAPKAKKVQMSAAPYRVAPIRTCPHLRVAHGHLMYGVNEFMGKLEPARPDSRAKANHARKRVSSSQPSPSHSIEWWTQPSIITWLGRQGESLGSGSRAGSVRAGQGE